MARRPRRDLARGDDAIMERAEVVYVVHPTDA